MSLKDELKDYATYEGARLYENFKEDIIDEIKNEVNKRSNKATIFWGWGSSMIPETDLIENIMDEIDLPYEWEFGHDAKGIEIKLNELYMEEK